MFCGSYPLNTIEGTTPIENRFHDFFFSPLWVLRGGGVDAPKAHSQIRH